jgi:hypothetical protein
MQMGINILAEFSDKPDCENDLTVKRTNAARAVANVAFQA